MQSNAILNNETQPNTTHNEGQRETDAIYIDKGVQKGKKRARDNERKSHTENNKIITIKEPIVGEAL